MTERDLKKLSRGDLLELLLKQTKENEQLKAELAEAQEKLASRTIMLDEAGSIAEASLKLNGVFEAAQAACSQYIENIQTLSARQERICALLEAETRLRCEEMLRTAKAEADAYKEEVEKKKKEFSVFLNGLQALNSMMDKNEE